MYTKEKTSSSCYYWCIVPMCKNTSIKTPGKTFIQVPRQTKRRQLWLQMVKRDPKEFSHTSVVFVCEDHFDLENDMENYFRWKMMGGPKLIKKEAVPHKFECQKKRIVTFSKSTLPKGDEQLELQELQRDLTEQNFINDPCKTEMVKSKTREIGVTAKPNYHSEYTQTPKYKGRHKKL